MKGYRMPLSDFREGHFVFPMLIIYFIYGLCFGGVGLAAYLQIRREADLPLNRELPWLASFGFACGATAWVNMFLVSGSTPDLHDALTVLRIILQPLTGVLLLRFGWGMLTGAGPLPPWSVFIPGLLIVPIAYVITYASTTFITPSPLEIPIDIWSRYLLYLPGSLLAGLGFVRQWHAQRKLGFNDVSRLMLGAGVAFLFEATFVGLVVPAAPYGPASYYNYDRVAMNAFSGEIFGPGGAFGMMAWLDYARILETTHLPIEFWRMVSAVLVTFFVVRSLDASDAIQKRQVKALRDERDRAQRAAFEAQIAARQTAEEWTAALVRISRQIAELDDVDHILLYIVESTKRLLRSDFVGVAVANREGDGEGITEVPPVDLELRCYADSLGSRMAEPKCHVHDPHILDTFQRSIPYRSQGAELLETCSPGGVASAGSLHTLAVVPLDLDEHPIGAFWIASVDPQPYSETDLIWLECLADQVVIAIKHGLMTAQLQSLSISEERGRIAREMHDGLAQVLGFMNLQVQTLESLLAQGKTDKLHAKLDQMRQAVQTAHADVRENILSLRTTLASDKGMIPAMTEYIEEFGIQTKIDVAFQTQVEGDLALSSIAEVQLVCILQEALSNVRKHSGAAHVGVELKREGEDENEAVVLVIKDDGVGFTAAGSRRSFGLQTMRERATSVNGELEIFSLPGCGTRVECHLPCLQPGKLNRKSLVLQ
jgi:signal transduction histidine kinase